MLRKLLLLMLVFPLGAQAPTLRIDGGSAPMNNIFKRIKPAFEKAHGITLELKESGPEGALLGLQKGEADVATAGLTPESWFELMAQKGIKGLDPKDFRAETIGFDKINVLVHGGLPILTLDKAQLKAVFTGQASNWKEIGGPDLPILLVLGKGMSGTNKVFQAQIMDMAPYSSKAKWVDTTPEVQAAIASNPGAVGIGPIASLRDMKLLSPVTPEVGRPITMLTKGGDLAPPTRKLLEFIRGDGKSLISK